MTILLDILAAAGIILVFSAVIGAQFIWVPRVWRDFGSQWREYPPEVRRRIFRFMLGGYLSFAVAGAFAIIAPLGRYSWAYALSPFVLYMLAFPLVIAIVEVRRAKARRARRH